MKKRIFAGVICDQIVYPVGEGTRTDYRGEPKPRFKDASERSAYNRACARRANERRINNSFTTAGYFITFTMSNEWECHDYEEAKRLRRNYYRRIKRAYPDAKLALYLGRGKSTDRIHMHGFIEGAPESAIIEKWTYGDVRRCQHLRAHNRYDGKDHGADFSAVATYCFNHWTEEQGGHYALMSRNVNEPESETAKECKREYTAAKAPRAPKGYLLGNIYYNRYGYICYRYYLNPTNQPSTDRRKGGRGLAL